MATPSHHPITGYSRYDTRRSPTDHVIEKVLPEGDVLAHLVRFLGPTPREPTFLDRWQIRRALCGAPAKVLLPFAFNASDPDACRHCLRHLENGTSGASRLTETNARTAHLTSNATDDVFWFVCDACPAVGPDREDPLLAENDGERHNIKKHDGADYATELY